MFTALRPGGRPAHQEAVQTANRAEGIAARQLTAYGLLCKGATFEQIGEQLGISNAQAHRDCAARREQLITFGIIEPKHVHVEQQALLNNIKLANATKLGVPANAKVVLAALQREARLNGCDAPLKIAQTDPSGTRRYDDLDDDALQREIERLVELNTVEAPPLAIEGEVASE